MPLSSLYHLDVYGINSNCHGYKLARFVIVAKKFRSSKVAILQRYKFLTWSKSRMEVPSLTSLMTTSRVCSNLQFKVQKLFFLTLRQNKLERLSTASFFQACLMSDGTYPNGQPHSKGSFTLANVMP